MKGIACGKCMDIRALPNIPPLFETVKCRCGNVRGRWKDPERGIAEYAAQVQSLAFGMGFNNDFLVPALRGATAMHEDARRLHDVATTAPGYVFDKVRAGCWAIVFRPGSTTDTSFVDWVDWEQAV